MRLMTILFLTAAGALACEAGPASPGAPPNGELPTRSRDVPVDKATDVQRVSWPARAAVDAATFGQLPAEARAEVAKSQIPVLVPAAMASTAKLVVRPAFTAVSITGTGEHLGLTVSVSATRVAHRYQNTPRAKGDKPAWITQNELIWSATWRENGVSYVVEVECARPSEDPRCASDAFLRTVVEDLSFVGGSFGGAQ